MAFTDSTKVGVTPTMAPAHEKGRFAMTEKEQQLTTADGGDDHEDVNGHLLPILVPPTPGYGGGFPNPLPPRGNFLPDGYWPGRDPRTADPIVQGPERCLE